MKRHKRKLTLETLEDRLLLSTVTGDFNGDGFDDLVKGFDDIVDGTRFHDVAGLTGAGVVNVLYGSANGFQNQQRFTQDMLDSGEGAGAGNHFGEDLAAGDFNGDGYDDLAVGVPHQVVRTRTDAGAVHILYGSENGLRATGTQFLAPGHSGNRRLA